MELLRAVPFLLLAGGILCFAWAAVTGGAAAGVFVIFPFVIGSGPAALVGVLLIAVGLLTLPWAMVPRDVPPPIRRPRNGEPDARDRGGVILVGPVPFFFGSWRSAPRWAYWAAVVVGSVLLLVVVLWELFLLR